jgi:hypothetical protein
MPDSTELIFESPISNPLSNPLLAVVPVGMWGSAAGLRSRSSTSPQAFVEDLSRRAVAVALIFPFLVINAEPAAYTSVAEATLV